MRKTKPKTNPSLKATTVQLRLRPAQKAAIARAAALCHMTLSNFMLKYADEAAHQILADQVDIAMSAEDWKAFCEALDAPPQEIPALRKLLTEASVFDGDGKAAAS